MTTLRDATSASKDASGPRHCGLELLWPGKNKDARQAYSPAMLVESHGAPRDGWFNRLYLGDNLSALSHLRPDFQGKIDLVYIDPPYGSRGAYTKKILHKSGGRKPQTGNARPAYFEEKQYGDIIDDCAYLQFMYERLLALKDLLAPTGAIYVHLDWRRAAAIRLIMDEILGADNFLNEIIWQYDGPASPSKTNFARKHDAILRYAKDRSRVKAYELYYLERETICSKKYKRDPQGQYYETIPIGDYSQEKIRELEARGLIERTRNGKVRLKKLIGISADGKYFEKRKKIPDVWNIVSLGQAAGSAENLHYPTQKPRGLLERIIRASTAPDDLVLDCFMGSATTQAVAMELGRRFIGVDSNPGSLQTATCRLRGIMAQDPGACGFNIYAFDSRAISGEKNTASINAIHDLAAKTAIDNGELVISHFSSPTLARRLGMPRNGDWRELVTSVAIDWDYNNDVFRPEVFDCPARSGLVSGHYPLPAQVGLIRIKITDLLSSSLEITHPQMCAD